METVSHISEKEKSENYVEIEINGKPMKVLMPEKEFQKIRKTTRFVATKVKLRPYGMSRLLEVIGRARVDMKNGNGQVITESVYAMRGQKGSEIETLLGSAAAKLMNILEIHPDGKSCTVNMITESKKIMKSMGLNRNTMTYFIGLGSLAIKRYNFTFIPPSCQ